MTPREQQKTLEAYNLIVGCMEWLTEHGYMPGEDATFSRADLAVDFVSQTYEVSPVVLRGILFNRMPRGHTFQERAALFDSGLALLSDDSESIVPHRSTKRQSHQSGLGGLLDGWDS